MGTFESNGSFVNGYMDFSSMNAVMSEGQSLWFSWDNRSVHDGSSTFVAVRPARAGWQDPELLLSASTWASSSFLLSGPQEELFLWQDAGGTGYRRFEDGVWGPQRDFDFSSSLTNRKITFSYEVNEFVLFSGPDQRSILGTDEEIPLASIPEPDTDWARVSEIIEMEGGFASAFFAAFVGEKRLYYASDYYPEKGWGEPQVLSLPLTGEQVLWSIAASPAGDQAVLFEGAKGSITALTRSFGAEWSPPVELAASIDRRWRRELAISASGCAVALWSDPQENTPDGEIIFRQREYYLASTCPGSGWSETTHLTDLKGFNLDSPVPLGGGRFALAGISEEGELYSAKYSHGVGLSEPIRHGQAPIRSMILVGNPVGGAALVWTAEGEREERQIFSELLLR